MLSPGTQLGLTCPTKDHKSFPNSTVISGSLPWVFHLLKNKPTRVLQGVASLWEPLSHWREEPLPGPSCCGPKREYFLSLPHYWAPLLLSSPDTGLAFLAEIKVSISQPWDLSLTRIHTEKQPLSHWPASTVSIGVSEAFGLCHGWDHLGSLLEM